MATGTLGKQGGSARALDHTTTDVEKLLWYSLRALGSLKITCAMFVLGVIILFVGTLAQDEQTIVDVKHDYFNSWIAVVPFDVFVPQTIWPHSVPLKWGFAMPGGATIGLVLLINLIAAKMTRFTMRAKGGRFVAGVFLTAIGFLLIALIVVSAHMGDGLQGEPPFSYSLLWFGAQVSVWVAAFAMLAWLSFWTPKTRLAKVTVGIITAIFFAIGAFLIVNGIFLNDYYRIPDPGLRIVWQLVKSLVVSSVLLAGLILLFEQRGGNVLIHLGVGLLMLGQFIFGDRQTEERVTLYEGQKTVVAYQPDIVELVVIKSKDEKENQVVAFDHPLLEQSKRAKTFLTESSLPFEIRVDKWMVNSSVKQRKGQVESTDDSAGVQGLGAGWIINETAPSGGAKSEVNLATALVTVRNKKDTKELGRFAVSQWLNDDTIMPRASFDTVTGDDGQTYQIGLRFRRNYKDYALTLNDVVLEEYTGTSIPKDYSSFVTVSGPDGSALQNGRIWMNNPMRFRGETFYQSGYASKEKTPAGIEQTTLQVVKNAGWLIPYVSCVLAGLGMLVHFGSTFARFAARYDRSTLPAIGASSSSSVAEDAAEDLPFPNPYAKKTKSAPNTKGISAPGYLVAAREGRKGLFGWLVPVATLVLVFGFLYGKAKIPSTDVSESIDWYRIGTLPVQHEGRMKPLSVVGGQILEALSNKPFALTLEGHSYEGSQSTGSSVTSSQWLMSVMAHDPWVLDAPLFRIDADELLKTMELTRHKSNRYSYNQVQENLGKLSEEIKTLDESNKESWNFKQQKLADLLTKLTIFNGLWNAYETLTPPINNKSSADEMIATIQRMEPFVNNLRERSPPAIIPPIREYDEKADKRLPPPKWEAYGPAIFDIVKAKIMGDNSVRNEETLQFIGLLEELRKDKKKPATINKLVDDYREAVTTKYASIAKGDRVGFEAWYKYFEPIALCKNLYVVSGVICFLSFMFWRQHLRRAGFWACVAVLLLHTFAIVCRIYISERPPVVSLYSAAVFIGWAMVLFCVVTEVLFPIAISVVLASFAGFLSLQVAYKMEVGDSMPVLQAVLDTQFWLSTHVTSVTLGYSATFVAGLVGITIIVISYIAEFVPSKQDKALREEMTEVNGILYRICYGIVCFGLFFSFVGTVLGGLWGDDSWGRFWGWDPKENGAMMIVLWNALLLHAKWDKLVGPLGFSMLAVFGNIITAWSMFGTNQLGIGLHAYGGFASDVLTNLFLFGLSQILVIVAGLYMVLRNRSKLRVQNV